MSSQDTSGSSVLLSSLLVSVLPNVPGAKTEAVTISDEQWEDVLWDREADEQRTVNQEIVRKEMEDIFVTPEDDGPSHSKGDRRSAYLIIGALRTDGLI
jgi:hypothetical protein